MIRLFRAVACFFLLVPFTGCGSSSTAPGTPPGNNGGQYDWTLEFGSPGWNAFTDVLWMPSGKRYFAMSQNIYTWDGGSNWVEYALPTGIVNASKTAPAAGNSYYASALWAASENDIFAVGGNGGIFRFEGTKWTLSPAPTSNRLYDVFGFSGSDVYAVGQSVILHWDGSQWLDMTPTTNTDWRSIWGTGPNNLFAVGGGGNIVHWTGTTWTPMTSNTTARLMAVFGTSTSDVYAAGASGVVRRFNGTAWSDISFDATTSFQGIWAPAKDNYYFVSTGTDIYHYNGMIWIAEPTPVGGMSAITGRSASQITISGGGGTVWTRVGSGWTWTGAPTTGSALGAWGLAEDDVWAPTSRGGQICHYDGVSWQAIDVGVDEFFWDVWASADNDVYMCGRNATMMHWNGASWNSINVGAAGFIRGMHGLDASNIFACGENGVAHYNGSNWTLLPVPANSLPWDVWAIAPDNAYVAAKVGIYHWNGSQLTTLNPPDAAGWRGVWASGPNDIWFVGEDGKIMHYDGVSTWDSTVPFTTSWLNSVFGFGPNDIYTSGQNGELYHYDGNAWNQETTGTHGTLYGLWGTPGGSIVCVGGNGRVAVWRK